MGGKRLGGRLFTEYPKTFRRADGWAPGDNRHNSDAQFSFININQYNIIIKYLSDNILILY